MPPTAATIPPNVNPFVGLASELELAALAELVPALPVGVLPLPLPLVVPKPELDFVPVNVVTV